MKALNNLPIISSHHAQHLKTHIPESQNKTTHQATAAHFDHESRETNSSEERETVLQEITASPVTAASKKKARPIKGQIKRAKEKMRMYGMMSLPDAWTGRGGGEIKVKSEKANGLRMNDDQAYTVKKAK